MTTLDKKHKKIDSLQSIRASAFLGIFLCHTGFDNVRGLGAWGVSVFIILSGFLMSYNYCDKYIFNDQSIIASIHFGIGKILKLYPLHILTMLAMAIFLLVGNGKETLSTVLTKLILNVLLIQEWFPIQNREINGMSWFLCEVLFFYIVYPYIWKYINEKTKNIKNASLNIVISITIIFIIGLLSNIYCSQSITKWIIYYCPLTRFWEFFIGCNLGYIFLKLNYTYSSKNNLILCRTFSIALVILSNIIYCKYSAHRFGNYAYEYDRWWIYTLLFIISSSMLILTFATTCVGGGGRTEDTRHIVNYIYSFLQNVAVLSPYAFLIHTVVFRYLSIFYYHIPGTNGEQVYLEYGRYINMTVGFGITMLLSHYYNLIDKKYRGKVSFNDHRRC